MLEKIIANFNNQFEYEPEIRNHGDLKRYTKFIICGMGGSNLAAGIINDWEPELDVISHRDYGLPPMEENELKERLVILSSYSGNTEETLIALREVLARNLQSVTITTGGRLLDLAQKNNTPYIQLPDIQAHPRFAIGLSIRATLKAMGKESVLNNISGEASSFNPDSFKEAGKKLSEDLADKIPMIYSSSRNKGLAYFWKINFNETDKLPAFFNIWPELNHNEMAGFSSKIFDGKLNHKFAFLFLNDPDDKPEIQSRMAATEKIFTDRGFLVLKTGVVGPSLWHKSFASILAAFWTSFFLAKYYSIDPEDISIIEDFKKSL